MRDINLFDLVVAPPLGTDLLAAGLGEPSEMRHNAAGKRAVTVPALEEADEAAASIVVCKRAGLESELVVK